MVRRRLYAAVFLAGAVVMAFEMAGSRVMAPAVGTSIVVWTALIGVILASLSFGYWWGGRLADRRPQPQRLAALLAWSSLAIAATVLLHPWVMATIAAAFSDIRLAAIVGAAILFAPAAVLLGTVSPYAAKLSISDLQTDGRTIGTLYAISTAGSIIGTFLGGFVLIPLLGTTMTLTVLAGLSAVAAVLAGPGRRALLVIGAACVTVGCSIVATRYANPGPVVLDTLYQRITVSQGAHLHTGRAVRFMSTGPLGIQAAQFVDGDELVFDYTRFFRMAELWSGERPERALAIGGAAYTWPRDFLARNPDSTMTVVEIDPGMTATARRFFRLTDDPALNIVHEDGRVFLNRTNDTYDAVYLDAFSELTIPFHLVTREAATRMRAAMSEEAILMANLVGSVTGENSQLVSAVTATFSLVFPHVYLFPLGTHGDPARIQNVMLVASARDLAGEFDTSLLPWQGSIAVGPVLTDDRAPVDLMSLTLLRER